MTNQSLTSKKLIITILSLLPSLQMQNSNNIKALKQQVVNQTAGGSEYWEIPGQATWVA